MVHSLAFLGNWKFRNQTSSCQFKKRCFCFPYRCSWVGFSERLQMLEFHPDLLKVAKNNKQNMQPNGDLQYWSFNTVESAQTEINQWAANKCFVFTPHTCTIILYVHPVHHSYMILWWCSMIPPQSKNKSHIADNSLSRRNRPKNVHQSEAWKPERVQQIVFLNGWWFVVPSSLCWMLNKNEAPEDMLLKKESVVVFLLDSLPSETLKKQHRKDTSKRDRCYWYILTFKLKTLYTMKRWLYVTNP